MPRRFSPPKYARHSSGQARVPMRGQVHYLGKYGSPKSKARYRELISEYLEEPVPLHAATISIGPLAPRCLGHAEAYYVKNGTVMVRGLTARAGFGRLFDTSDWSLAGAVLVTKAPSLPSLRGSHRE